MPWASRYLPMLVYPKGAPGKAAFFGHRLETHQKEVSPFWTPEGNTGSGGSLDAMRKAVDYVRKSGVQGRARRRGDGIHAGRRRRRAAGRARRQRGEGRAVRAGAAARREAPEELALLRKASELVIDSMQAVMAKIGPGTSKRELSETLRREEVNRGLTFEYLLITAGTSLNRAPSDYKLGAGRHRLPRIRAATTTAISATSAAWRSWASRTPSSRTCWARSR